MIWQSPEHTNNQVLLGVKAQQNFYLKEGKYMYMAEAGINIACSYCLLHTCGMLCVARKGVAYEESHLPAVEVRMYKMPS